MLQLLFFIGFTTAVPLMGITTDFAAAFLFQLSFLLTLLFILQKLLLHLANVSAGFAFVSTIFIVCLLFVFIVATAKFGVAGFALFC